MEIQKLKAIVIGATGSVRREIKHLTAEKKYIEDNGNGWHCISARREERKEGNSQLIKIISKKFTIKKLN